MHAQKRKPTVGGPSATVGLRTQRPSRPVRSTPRSDTRSFYVIWAVACFLAYAFAAHSALTRQPGEPPQVWLVATVAFTWLTMVWPNDSLVPRLSPRLVLTLLSLAGIGVMSGLLMDASVTETLLSAVGIPVQAYVMAAGTRIGRRLLALPPHGPVPGASPWRSRWAQRWAPSGAIDMLALALGALISAVVSLAVGAVPGLFLTGVSAAEAVQWIIHVMIISIVGGSTTLIIFPTWSPEDRSQPWPLIVAIWVGSVGVLLWVHAMGIFSVAWLQIIPTLIIALTCRLWVTALFSLSLGAVSVLLSPRLNQIDRFADELPLGTSMDLLVATLIMTALTLAFLDRRRNDLVDDLGRERAKTASHLAMMERTFEAMHEGVLVFSADLRLQFHNSAASDLLGRTFPHDPPSDWTRYLEVCALDGRPLSDRDLRDHEHVVVTTPRGRRVLHQRSVGLGDYTGNSIMVVLADVTENWDRMDELSGFAGVVAHDMRTPLTSLEGWLELTAEALAGGRTAEAEVMVQRARGGNRRMRQIIDDWLDYTVDRQGTLEVTTFALAPVVNAVMSHLAESAPHRFSLDVHHEVSADQATVRQVLANLIGNAAKFCRPGTTPQISVRSYTTDSGMIQVEVEDRGIGLPEGLEEVIFDEYQRGSGPALEVEGFGLGLALCKRVVERHGGAIWAQTNVHGGATFTFTLPAAEPDEPEAQTPPQPRERTVPPRAQATGVTSRTRATESALSSRRESADLSDNGTETTVTRG